MHPERSANPDRSPDSLEARLRALPSPPVPADLEARLLATIPSARRIPQRRWGVWVGAAVALAAACLLAVLAWSSRDGGSPTPPTVAAAHPVTPREPNGAAVAAWLKARRDLDDAELPAFAWPLGETASMRNSTSIPADLLD